VPEVLSGLSVSPARRGRVDVADGASCVTVIDASWATIDLTPGGLDPRWEPYVEKTLRIDGEVWARRIPGKPEQSTYGTLNQSVTRVHAACGSMTSRLGPGEHVAELSVSFPGTDRSLVASAPLRLRCDAPAGDAPLLRPLPPGVEGPRGCGCSSGQAGPLLLLLLGAWRRRIRR
jgi:MYXO-CTERM domain-containing protein